MGRFDWLMIAPGSHQRTQLGFGSKIDSFEGLQPFLLLLLWSLNIFVHSTYARGSAMA